MFVKNLVLSIKMDSDRRFKKILLYTYYVSKKIMKRVIRE